MFRLIVVVLFLLQGASVSASETAFKIIVNEKNPASSITRKGAAKIFTKQLIRWNTGLLAVPVDLPSSAPVRQHFSQDVLAMDAAAAASQANAPTEVPLEQVVTFVQANPGAIAYVPVDFPTAGVKVILLQ